MKKLLVIFLFIMTSASAMCPVESKGIFTKQNEQVTILLEGTSNIDQMIEVGTMVPANGTLSVITPLTGPPTVRALVVYTPNPDFSGIDTFTYQFVGGGCEATVTIAVLSGDPSVDLSNAILAKYIQFCSIP